MNEQIPRWIPSGLEYEQLKEALKQQYALKQANAVRPPVERPSAVVPPQQYAPIPLYLNPDTLRNYASERRKKRVKRVLSLLAVGIVVPTALTAGAYVSNFGGFQDSAQNFFGLSDAPSGSELPVNGLTMSKTKVVDQKSLSPEQCTVPEAMFLVATVSASFPLVPILAETSPETGKSTVIKIPPYMTKANEKTLPVADRAEFDKFVTPEDGYNHATINNLPLALEICEPTTTIYETNGVFVIDRSKLQVSFVDPIQLLKTPMQPVYQIDSATDVTSETGQGQYSLPNPLKKMYIQTANDPILKQSVEDMTKSMQDPEQIKLLLALIETGAVKQLDNVVKKEGKVTYEDKTDKALQGVIDKLLLQRLAGDTNKKASFGGNYVVNAEVPRDPVTKRYITDDAVKNLKYLDAKQPVTITNISVKYGGVRSPKPSPIVAK